LHLIERWTRTGPSTLAYEVTIEDPTVWTQPWTVKQEFTKQTEQQNRIYYEPRCVEGNYGLPGLLHGRRMEELAFAQVQGPATPDNVGALVDKGSSSPSGSVAVKERKVSGRNVKKHREISLRGIGYPTPRNQCWPGGVI
jgi:hypothetical protein